VSRRWPSTVTIVAAFGANLGGSDPGEIGTRRDRVLDGSIDKSTIGKER